MSHFLGMRRSHHQMRSPSPNNHHDFNITVSTSPSDVSQDSKDVLVQRLADLSDKLDSSEDLADDDIAALHLEVDRMERVIRGTRGARQDGGLVTPKRNSFSRTMTSMSEDDSLWGPASPVRQIGLGVQMSGSPQFERQPMLPAGNKRLAMTASMPNMGSKFEQEMPTQQVQALATEADLLQERLTTALKELKARKEETNQIHDFLVSTSSATSHRIAFLEGQVADLHDDHSTLLSKLSFLRIQLKALEVQAAEYIPFDADAELSTSIRNWKLEWADVDMRTRKNKKRCEDVMGGHSHNASIG